MPDVLILGKNQDKTVITVNSESELIYIPANGRSEIIYKNMSTDFDVAVEEDKTIDVLAVTLSGTLVFLCYAENNWKIRTILDSRGDEKRINAVRLLKINSLIHIFYCISYEERMMLVHQISGEKSFDQKPQIIDYVDSRCVYDVCADDEMNIHIVYETEDMKLRCLRFLNSQKKHTKPADICEGDIRCINAVVYDHTLFAAYLSREREYNVINTVRADTSEKCAVGFGVDAISEPCIFSDGVKLYIQWCERGNSFECSSDEGFSFNRPYCAGMDAHIVRLKSSQSCNLIGIGKCLWVKGSLTPSALKAYKACIVNLTSEFKIKGSDAEDFARKSIDYIERKYESAALEQRLFELEKRLDIIEKHIGEIATDENIIEESEEIL